MSKTLEIDFYIQGTINQEIEILTEETPEEFKAKLTNGTYITTVGDGKIIMELPTMNTVGIIKSQTAVEVETSLSESEEEFEDEE